MLMLSRNVIAALQRRLPRLVGMLYNTRKWAYPARRAWFRLAGKTHFPWRYYAPSLVAAVGMPEHHSDIRDHYGVLFSQAVSLRPRLIVELGTRGGGSTCALLAASHLTGSRMLSIDLDDCGALNLPFREHWNFVRADDTVFGVSGFPEWCRNANLPAEIDLLFIDTSHVYEHTKQEIQVWEPWLSASGTMIFHDTNMGRGVYARTDGSVAIGWNNRRGVIRAIEEFLGRTYDETAYFCDLAKGYLVIHHPSCNGLTILRKCGLTDVGPGEPGVFGTK